TDSLEEAGDAGHSAEASVEGRAREGLSPASRVAPAEQMGPPEPVAGDPQPAATSAARCREPEPRPGFVWNAWQCVYERAGDALTREQMEAIDRECHERYGEDHFMCAPAVTPEEAGERPGQPQIVVPQP
ncbi:MAG: hypothetical protein OXC11_09710, partial [Rhodospirillales bacterium]|nr:hypothetical protein [Rhodospirillales bacterium]